MSPRLFVPVVESLIAIVRVIVPVDAIVADVPLLGGLKLNVPSAAVVTLTPPMVTVAAELGGAPVSARSTRPVTSTGVPPPPWPPPPPPPPPQPASAAAANAAAAASPSASSRRRPKAAPLSLLPVSISLSSLCPLSHRAHRTDRSYGTDRTYKPSWARPLRSFSAAPSAC